MAAEISIRHTATGVTLYATIRAAARTYWNGSALESLVVANWGTYDLPLAETPASSYFYVCNWPEELTTPGWYWIDIYTQAGASPAIGDTLEATLIGYWDGTTFGPWAADVREIAGDDPSEQIQAAAAAAIADVELATPAAVWSHAQRTLTSSAAEVAAALTESAITILRGDTLTVSWSGLGDLSSRTKLWVTGKSDKNHPDSAALFQVIEAAGLAIIAGGAAATAANASVVVTDEDEGDVTLTIKGVETAKLQELANGSWDLQILTTAGPQTIIEGTLEVTLDVTRATS